MDEFIDNGVGNGMSTGTHHYVTCDNKCKVPAYTKGQIDAYFISKITTTLADEHLSDIGVTGYYAQLDKAKVLTSKGYPLDYIPGVLEVIGANGSNIITQVFTCESVSHEEVAMFKRIKKPDDTWTNWTKMLRRDELQLLFVPKVKEPTIFMGYADFYLMGGVNLRLTRAVVKDMSGNTTYNIFEQNLILQMSYSKNASFSNLTTMPYLIENMSIDFDYEVVNPSGGVGITGTCSGANLSATHEVRLYFHFILMAK